ncbi:MAG: hypothetical protein WBX25_04045 [Rhodomicrobium sp.]
MTVNIAATAIPPRNALIASAAQIAPAPQAAANGRPSLPALLATTIGHAAVLSDTPEKWAGTIAMLRQNGVNPAGYEDFEKGRTTAIQHSGITLPQSEEDLE